jgi:hypothetical protein
MSQKFCALYIGARYRPENAVIEIIRISDTERNINVNIGKPLQDLQVSSVLL